MPDYLHADPHVQCCYSGDDLHGSYLPVQCLNITDSLHRPYPPVQCVTDSLHGPYPPVQCLNIWDSLHGPYPPVQCLIGDTSVLCEPPLYSHRYIDVFAPQYLPVTSSVSCGPPCLHHQHYYVSAPQESPVTHTIKIITIVNRVIPIEINTTVNIINNNWRNLKFSILIIYRYPP